MIWILISFCKMTFGNLAVLHTSKCHQIDVFISVLLCKNLYRLETNLKHPVICWHLLLQQDLPHISKILLTLYCSWLFVCNPVLLIAEQWRIQDFPLGDAYLRCGHFSVEMYAKTKELGPVGGRVASGNSPWICQCWMSEMGHACVSELGLLLCYFCCLNWYFSVPFVASVDVQSVKMSPIEHVTCGHWILLYMLHVKIIPSIHGNGKHMIVCDNTSWS